MNIAIDCEATALMYRDGWYYLLGTHGTCCDGPNSTYNIRVGRSRKVSGPYLDNPGHGHAPGRRQTRGGRQWSLRWPGHFGLLDLGDGVQKFSCHYEADLERSGRSVLDVRALLWKDGLACRGREPPAALFKSCPNARVTHWNWPWILCAWRASVPRGMSPGGTNAPGRQAAGLMRPVGRVALAWGETLVDR